MENDRRFRYDCEYCNATFDKSHLYATHCRDCELRPKKEKVETRKKKGPTGVKGVTQYECVFCKELPNVPVVMHSTCLACMQCWLAKSPGTACPGCGDPIPKRCARVELHQIRELQARLASQIAKKIAKRN